jgi:hypothetical protein
MITWFGPVERQLKEGLFDGHFLAKHLFGKGPQPPFLVIAVLQIFSAAT